MKNLTIISSVLLIALGLFGYLGWQTIGATAQSPTALIPAVVGILMLAGGFIAGKNPSLGSLLSLIFAALGALAALGRLIPQGMKNGFSFQGASLLMWIMTAICVFYTIMAIRARGSR